MMRASRYVTLKHLSMAIGLVLLTGVSSVYASGFQLFEYSGAAVGNDIAGGAAEANDATTATTNPAGLVRLQSPTMSISGVGIWGQTTFDGQACGGAGSFCRLTPVNQSGDTYNTIPSLQIAVPINQVLSAGLSITSPFGLETDYNAASSVAYTATLSQIQTMDISPSLGIKVTPKLSVGLGLDAQRMLARLNQAVNVAPPLGVPNAMAKSTASDWAYGWNAGALWQFTENTRVGADFHSHVVHNISGHSLLEGGYYGLVENGQTGASINLPAYTMLSAFHQFNDKWSLMGTGVYTDWKQIQQISVGPVVQPRIVTGLPPAQALGIAATQTQLGTVTFPENFDSTWHLSLGTDYQATEHWRLRAGAGYDESPVNSVDRGVRLPDANRYQLAGGLRYTFNAHASLDAAYTHVFIRDGSINQQQALYKTIGTAEDGAGNLVGLQLNLTA